MQISNEQLSKNYKETSNPKLTEKRKNESSEQKLKKINLSWDSSKKEKRFKQIKTKEKLSQNIPQNTMDHKKMRKIKHQQIEKEKKKIPRNI